MLGKALRLDPWAEEGLTGTVRLARVREADEALSLIDDGLLAVSAGFGVAQGGDEWRGSQRRGRRAVLDHISLVPEHESARITTVRSTTPNLDRALELLAGAR